MSSWSKHSYAKSWNEAALEISQKANGTISFCKVQISWLCKILFTSIEKIYQEPALESLEFRRWFRKLHFFKIFNEKFPSYFFNSIPSFNRVHNTRLRYNILPIKVRRSKLKPPYLHYQSAYGHQTWHDGNIP